jgi:ketosteroid isomerase-like protein
VADRGGIGPEPRTGAPPEEDTETRLRAGYAALSDGDIEPVLPLLHPDVEIRDRPESPDASVYHGHDGARAAFRVTIEMFDEVKMEPEEFFAEGDDLVVVLRLRGLGKESGVPVEERLAHHWQLRDGLAARLQVYSDPADALAAAGIRP